MLGGEPPAISQPHGRGVDGLLDDYMRVINQKDSEILDLVAKVEKLEVELRTKTERHRAKSSQTKVAIRELQTTLEVVERDRTEASREAETLRQERDRLVDDVSTLRMTVQRHEDHLKGVLKTSSKAHKYESLSRERLEQEMRDLKRSYEEKAQSTLDRVAALEAQLAVAVQRQSETADEAHRLRTEVKRTAFTLSEREREVALLSKKAKDCIPRQEAAAEVQQLEERHQVKTSRLEQELKHVQQELATASTSASRRESASTQLRGDAQRLEHEAAALKRALQDADLALSQERLSAAQQLDELRADFELRLQDAEEHGARVARENAVLDGDITVLRKRTVDLEGHVEEFRRTLTDRDDTISELRQAESDRVRELDASSRLVAQLQQALRSSSEQTTTRVERVDKELASVRNQLDVAVSDASRLRSVAESRESTIADLRREVQRLGSLESDLRLKLADCEASHQAVLNEMRVKATQHSEEMQEHQASVARARADSSREISQLAARVKSLEGDNSRLQSAIDVTSEKERHLRRSQQETDGELSRVQVELADRESTVAALRRAAEENASSASAQTLQIEASRRALETAQSDSEGHRSENSRLRTLVKTRESELEEVRVALRRTDEASKLAGQSSSEEINTLQQRLRTVVTQLNDAEQKTSLLEAQRNKDTASHADELARLQRESVAPLHDRVDTLSTQNTRLERVLQDREREVAQLSSAVRERDELRRELEGAMSELQRTRASLQQSADAERVATVERDTSRRLRGELEALQSKVTSLQTTLDSASRELKDLHTQQVQHTSQLSAKNADISALQERLRNAESLKRMAEQQVHDLQGREADILRQLDEARSQHAMLQACFDKQQEQLRTGQRLRELDSEVRSRSGFSAM